MFSCKISTSHVICIKIIFKFIILKFILHIYLKIANKLYTHYVYSSANSINWGRLMPQIVSHISSYLELVKKNKILLGDEVDVTVPSGNFGNLLTVYYAKVRLVRLLNFSLLIII